MRPFPGAALWKLQATHGLPLDMALVRLAQEGLVPTWLELFEAARKDGANLRRLHRAVQFFVTEAYGPPIAAAINSRLSLLSH